MGYSCVNWWKNLAQFDIISFLDGVKLVIYLLFLNFPIIRVTDMHFGHALVCIYVFFLNNNFNLGKNDSLLSLNLVKKKKKASDFP